jgi:hypothetical protein
VAGVGKPGRAQFYELVRRAIADLIEHGFDSQERLDYWLRELEIAARDALIPENVLQTQLREALERAFHRSLTGGGLVRAHRGVDTFTIAAIKPKLHAELNRRIEATANLIKLNREASIARTLQRFSGWAMSVPVGGTEVAERREVAENVRRGVAGLPFEERRVVIDQGHKLVAAINEIVATDGGAIAAAWKHVREGGGYQARPEHVARNDHIFAVRGNWALEQGLMKLAGRQYTDEIEAPGELVYCRCQYVYVYNLRDLPPDMLTSKGREELERVREQLRILK